MTKQQMKVIAQAEHEMFCLRDLLEGSVPAKVMNLSLIHILSTPITGIKASVNAVADLFQSKSTNDVTT